LTIEKESDKFTMKKKKTTGAGDFLDITQENEDEESKDEETAPEVFLGYMDDET
jgi:hypothetical protein